MGGARPAASRPRRRRPREVIESWTRAGCARRSRSTPKRASGGERMGQKAVILYFRCSPCAAWRRGARMVRQDGAQARLRGAGRARRAPCRGTLRRLHRPGAIPHALVCQYRRLRRYGHDGRYVGHGRLVRPDRTPRPPLGRRGNRRRAGARAGRAGHHRGQLFPSARARSSSRGRTSAARRCSDRTP